jgi:hypothetical protein
MKRTKRFLDIDRRWSVAFAQQDWRGAEFWRGIKFRRKPFHSLADPFVFSKDGRNYCFVEDLDHLRNHGTITVFELTDDDSIFIGTALKEDFHLSFPFLFEFEGELYMCPETSQKKEIRIYKCIDFPLRWKLEKIVMKDISAVDTMLFERDGKWWMLTNIDPTEIGDYGSELFVFSASSPLESNWTAIFSIRLLLTPRGREMPAARLMEIDSLGLHKVSDLILMESEF